MATKSLIERVEIDRALRAHNCQANRRHRLEHGHARLKVRKGRSWDHYCAACAVVILERDIGKLRDALGQLQAAARAGTSDAVEHGSPAARSSEPAAEIPRTRMP